jgi:hypothetical protein
MNLSCQTIFPFIWYPSKNFHSTKLRDEPNRTAWAAGKNHYGDQQCVGRGDQLRLSPPHCCHLLHSCHAADDCIATYAVTLPLSLPYYFSSLLSLLVELQHMLVSWVSPLYKRSPCVVYSNISFPSLVSKPAATLAQTLAQTHLRGWIRFWVISANLFNNPLCREQPMNAMEKCIRKAVLDAQDKTNSKSEQQLWGNTL